MTNVSESGSPTDPVRVDLAAAFDSRFLVHVDGLRFQAFDLLQMVGSRLRLLLDEARDAYDAMDGAVRAAGFGDCPRELWAASGIDYLDGLVTLLTGASIAGEWPTEARFDALTAKYDGIGR